MLNVIIIYFSILCCVTLATTRVVDDIRVKRMLFKDIVVLALLPPSPPQSLHAIVASVDVVTISPPPHFHCIFAPLGAFPTICRDFSSTNMSLTALIWNFTMERLGPVLVRYRNFQIISASFL